jgi:hypothetical protein
MTGDFLKDWEACFEDVLPDGQELRQEWPDRWTRFHGLPNAKRLAETPVDTSEILRRANTLADALFGPNEKIWVATCHWLASGDRPSPKHLSQEGIPMALCREWPLPADYFEVATVPVYVTQMDWTTNAADGLLRRAAEDCGNVVLFSPRTGRALAPYDGGFDLFAHSRMLRRLERDHRGWMSEREDRL